jgi:hypothetical protein
MLGQDPRGRGRAFRQRRGAMRALIHDREHPSVTGKPATSACHADHPPDVRPGGRRVRLVPVRPPNGKPLASRVPATDSRSSPTCDPLRDPAAGRAPHFYRLSRVLQPAATRRSSAHRADECALQDMPDPERAAHLRRVLPGPRDNSRQLCAYDPARISCPWRHAFSSPGPIRRIDTPLEMVEGRQRSRFLLQGQR